MKTFKHLDFETSSFYFLLMALLLYGLYPLLALDPITSYDDKLLLGGIEDLHSFDAYIKNFFAGKVLDLQPVRDFSYLIDFKLKSITGFYSFHLSNLLIWFLICIVLKNIFNILGNDSFDNQRLAWSIVFLYALSPVSASSVAWIAARKHLLSTFFTLLATWLFLKKRNSHFSPKSVFSISLFYILATLSQPINVLWPLFVLVYSYFDKKLNERKAILFILSSIAIIIICANFYYYEYLYPTFTAGDGKYDSNFGAGVSLLALGRYFYLTLFPFDALPISHYQGSWKNLIGITLLVVFLYFSYKKGKEKPALICFFLYFFIPLIPVTYKITRIFCSDTYLLNASLGIYISIFLVLKNLRFKFFYIIFFIYAGFLFSYNLDYLKIFKHADNIWLYSYEKEPTPMSIVNLTNLKITEKNFSEARSLLNQLEVLEPENRFFIKLKADVIYKDSKVLSLDKIKMLESLEPRKPIVFLYLALLYSNNNNPSEFEKNIFSLFSNSQSYIENSYLNNEEVLALTRVTCEKNKIEVACKKYFDNLRKQVEFKNWNSERYSEMYSKFKKHPDDVVYE